MSVPPYVTLPARVRRVDLPTASGPLAALRADPPERVAGRSDVLLVPGFTGSKEDFIAILDPLAAAGHRVTALDLRGQCDSTGPEEESAYTVEALGADVRRVLAGLAGRVHVLGHSFGGLVARSAVVADPAGVASCTLLASGPAALPPPGADQLRAARAILDRGGVPAVWAASRSLELRDPSYRPPPPDVAAFLERRYLGTPAACLGGMARALLTEPDRVDELRAAAERAGVPLLVAYGPGDDAWPPAAQAEMAQRLGARHVVVPGARHSPAVERPTLTVELLLDFWRSVDAPSPALP